eukprot:358192-Chlamydomonas_euryale.AAC.11
MWPVTRGLPDSGDICCRALGHQNFLFLDGIQAPAGQIAFGWPTAALAQLIGRKVTEYARIRLA